MARQTVWFLGGALAFALAFAAPPLSARQQKAQSKQGEQAKGRERVEVHAGVTIFSGRDRDIIKDYWKKNRSGLPPGLAKRGGNLPPGLEKQLRRKGHLPPGLEKNIVPFPAELERRLPTLREGLGRGVIHGRGVIYNLQSSEIMDIFELP